MITLALCLALLQEGPQESQDEMKKRVERLEKELAEVKKRLEPQEPGPQEGDLARRAQEAKRDAGEVYSKPFLARFGRDVYLGGYMDLEYVNTEDTNGDTFDQHRLVPFIYADISKNVKLATEIEIEHGNGTELGVEFAHIDYWISDLVNVRAGIILDPLGRYNLVHDAPYQDLTQRPLVAELITGTVLREPGVGLFGQIDADPWEFDYELYVVNGFKGLSKTGATVISRAKGLRDARPHGSPLGTKAYRDFNDDKALVGRFSASPFLGLEAGVSTHAGKYDERGDNLLAVHAVDVTARLGGVGRSIGIDSEILGAFEVVFEFAKADIGRDALAKTAGVPGDMDGYTVEVRCHFMPEAVRRLIPGAVEESTFTLVYRYDAVDLDGAERAAHTFGINFRLREDTVVKFEYQIREEDGLAPEIDDDTFAASIATYF
jgi:hypothetical protein